MIHAIPRAIAIGCELRNRFELELELEQIQTQMTQKPQKPMLRMEVEVKMRVCCVKMRDLHVQYTVSSG